MEELKQLEHLSLMSKICTELYNHLGLIDKDLAEFIIELTEKNQTFAKVKIDFLEETEFKSVLVSRRSKKIQTKPLTLDTQKIKSNEVTAARSKNKTNEKEEL